MSETKTAPEPAAKLPVTATLTLQHPIQREGGEVGELVLRKPKASELRGLTIQSLMVGDVSAVITLLPRISAPIINAHEAGALEAEDIAEAAGTIMGFFMTTAQKAAIAQALGG